MATIRRQIDCMATYSKIRIEETIAQRQRGLRRPPGEYSWTIADVSEKTYLDFLQRFRKELENLAAQAKFDESTLKKSELKKAVINFGAQLEDMESPHLKIIDDVFDGYLKSESLKGEQEQAI